jgi:heme/copper-type cytochrome/quinol oxidase subunit 3
VDEILRTEVAVEPLDARAAFADALEAESSRRVSSPQLALFVVLATVAMLFAGFASAYLVRRSSADWQQEYLPPILRLNTIVLVASSVALELAQRARRANEFSRMKSWIAAGAGLGLLRQRGLHRLFDPERTGARVFDLDQTQARPFREGV